MHTWTLTSTEPLNVIIGSADTEDQAGAALLAAARQAIHRTARTRTTRFPRYTLHRDDTLIVILGTGATDDGHPDHSGVEHLLDDMLDAGRLAL
ncbi:MAG: hypothetical protein ACSLFA_28205 [Mycobacterium sp.]